MIVTQHGRWAMELRAILAKLLALERALDARLTEQQKAELEERLALLGRRHGQLGGAVFFPWLDTIPGSGGGQWGTDRNDPFRAPGPTDPDGDSGEGLPGDSSMIEYEPLDSGGGSGGGF